jgi:hypothetical protein
VPQIEESVFGDMFFENNLARPVAIDLQGDGSEARAIQIFRGQTETLLPFNEGRLSTSSPRPFTFKWVDNEGKEHSVVPSFSNAGAHMPNTGESLDTDRFFYFAANQPLSSAETAGRFSELSKSGKEAEFIKALVQEFNWISDLRIEISAGIPALYVKTKGSAKSTSMPNISSGVNRITAILLALASQKNAIMLIDEIENGIYYAQQVAIWKRLWTFLKQQESQMFVTTHSKEMLRALLKGVPKNDHSRITLWRTTRSSKGHSIEEFTGSDLEAAIEMGEEVR